MVGGIWEVKEREESEITPCLAWEVVPFPEVREVGRMMSLISEILLYFSPPDFLVSQN